ncbi:MAG: N-6 DNA methylase [Nitrospirae bacterium]|nr:N-6 DNA methylase [Nitrospirota bacterium]
MPERSESDYILNDIVPLLTRFGYPNAGDHERIKVDTIPTFGATGKKSGSMDIVYYHEGEPLLLVEAKRKYKAHDAALKQAEYYIRNFPSDKKEYAKSGIPPRYIATTVGKEIKFYYYKTDIKNGIAIRQISEPIEILRFDELLEKYGLVKGYKPKTLDAESFRKDFLNYLLDVYTPEDRMITKDVIEKISLHILSYLQSQKTYTLNPPYSDLAGKLFKQELAQDLHRRFDLLGSLSPEVAKEYRSFILRAFQGTKLNQYLTEQCVIEFMFDLIGEINPDWKVLDFECGSGGFLAIAAERGVPAENMLGIDIDELPCIIAKTYLALHFGKTGREIGRIPIKEGNGLLRHGNDWDLVVGNPAGSSLYGKNDIETVLKNLERDLNIDGKDDIFSEYNFSIQQAVRSCRVGGRICLVLPEGFFSNSQDEFLRRYVAKHCRVLAIVSLPRGVFKKGKTTKSMETKGQVATMKMSILYAEKLKLVIDGAGIDAAKEGFEYPVFMTNITSPESTAGEVCKWLKSRLNMVLNEWESWKWQHQLVKLGNDR